LHIKKKYTKEEQNLGKKRANNQEKTWKGQKRGEIEKEPREGGHLLNPEWRKNPNKGGLGENPKKKGGGTILPKGGPKNPKKKLGEGPQTKKGSSPQKPWKWKGGKPSTQNRGETPE